MDGFIAMMDQLDDPRTGNGIRYSLAELLYAVLAAMLTGAQSCVQIADFAEAQIDFLRERLPYTHGAPSHDTISRLFQMLDSTAFEIWFVSFMKQFAAASGDPETYAVDGKTLRGSHDAEIEQSALHTVNVWASEQRLVLAQKAVDSKSNEIPTVREVLSMLSLEGVTVTADAMHCQRETAQQIVASGGDCILAVKGNQGTLREELEWFWEQAPAGVDEHRSVAKGHGRLDVRTARTTSNIEWIQEVHEWPGLQSVVEIKRKRELGNEVSSKETAHFLSSRRLSAEEANRLVREHWSIENSVHWVLDMTFDEDRSRIRRDNAPANMALMRKLVLNAVRMSGSKMSVNRQLYRASFDLGYRRELLARLG